MTRLRRPMLILALLVGMGMVGVAGFLLQSDTPVQQLTGEYVLAEKMEDPSIASLLRQRGSRESHDKLLSLFKDSDASLSENPETEYVWQFSFHTSDIRVLETSVGAGEHLLGRIKLEPASCELLFWVTSPSGQRVIDAGRIGDGFFFSFEAPLSGDYWLFFDDPWDSCAVVLQLTLRP